MSSSDRVLAGTPTGDGSVTLLVAPQRHHDAATRAALDEARAEGRAQGHAEGLAQGRAEVEQAVAHLADDLEVGLAALREDVAAQHEQLAAALEQRVLACVRAVLDREPDDAGRGLLHAVTRDVAAVDAPALVVHVAPQRLEPVRAGLSGAAGVEVTADESLGPDDARVLAPTVDVDLRRERLLTELGVLLEAGSPLGALVPDQGHADG